MTQTLTPITGGKPRGAVSGGTSLGSLASTATSANAMSNGSGAWNALRWPKARAEGVREILHREALQIRSPQRALRLQRRVRRVHQAVVPKMGSKAEGRAPK